MEHRKICTGEVVMLRIEDNIYGGKKCCAEYRKSVTENNGCDLFWQVIEKIGNELQEYGLRDPTVEVSYDDLRQLPYISDVIREVLRISPACGGGFRRALQTFDIGVSKLISEPM